MAVVFSKTTMAGFGQHATDAWKVRAAQDLLAQYPDHYAAFGVSAPALEPLCSDVNNFAVQNGIDGERDVFRLCLIAASLGHRFWEDPRFERALAASVYDPNLPATRRPLVLAKKAGQWLSALWQNDSLAGYGARLVDALQNPSVQPDLVTLQQLVPGHWALLSDAENEQFCDWLWRGLNHDRFSAPAQKLVCLTSVLVHGTGWLTDPQYARIAERIDDMTDGVVLAARLGPIYAELSA